ncbi:MAG: FkbM family methyltransferase [Planctomycetes bacterium]|nr:FkbM family methyltransferase [Planctomycetota bacterium]
MAENSSSASRSFSLLRLLKTIKLKLRKKMKKPLDHTSFDWRSVDIKVIRMFDIDSCGIESDGTPFIRLMNGLIFYSYPCGPGESALFRENRDVLPPKLTEECMKVALDMAQYYHRENSMFHQPPKTSHLYPGWGFVDLGTHLGYASIKASRKLGENGMVVAVEASPGCFELLKRNVEANELKNVRVVHAAVSDHDGELKLFKKQFQHNSIHETLHDQFIQSSESKYQNFDVVPSKKLDTILRETGYPVKDLATLVSAEINGAEILALQGARDFLRDSPEFYMRIAARYGGDHESSIRDDILGLLSTIDNVEIRDVPPYVYGARYRGLES